MPAETTTPTDSRNTKSSHDAVAWALSGVTCAVLAIGVLVIRSTMPTDGGNAHSGDQHETQEALISIGTPNETKPGEYITLQPLTPDPRPLPPAETEDASSAEAEPTLVEPTVPPSTAFRADAVELNRQ